ncbi:MAG: hypothetical protein MUE85_17515 [Microscillaceae bacterium]|jgi:uncharacterized membrane protein YcgQ (UPF0703/DUF1980 family)|nr:hypothetical protein [Microscillaceae bacterium]
MQKLSLLLLLFFFSSQVAFAQVKSKQGQSRSASFSGTILQKPWTKSAQSYCAQGSDYFVLKTNKNQEWVLENTSTSDLKDFVDKKVKITGFIRTKKIEANPNEVSQRPVEIGPDGKEVANAAFTCQVLVIKKIQ